MAPKETFHLCRPEITSLDSDYFRWRPALFGKLNEVRIGSYDCELILARVVPNDGIRRELRKARVKDMCEAGK